MDDKEKAKEEALDKYLSRCDHEPDSPNYKGWPMSVCDVCRGRFSEESFEAGFGAGLAHAQQSDKTPVSESVDVLCEALRSDEDFYFAWQSNIAMPFVDAYSDALKSEAGYHPDVDIHEVANNAAKRFLDSLIAPKGEQQ